MEHDLAAKDEVRIEWRPSGSLRVNAETSTVRKRRQVEIDLEETGKEFLSVVAYGTFTGDLGTGIGYVFSPTNEFGLANLNVFLSAVMGSALVTVLGSYALPDES